jgi:hypothetical protein
VIRARTAPLRGSLLGYNSRPSHRKSTVTSPSTMTMKKKIAKPLDVSKAAALSAAIEHMTSGRARTLAAELRAMLEEADENAE